VGSCWHGRKLSDDPKWGEGVEGIIVGKQQRGGENLP